MKSTLAVLILTAIATSVFAIEQITATTATAAAESDCSCEKDCSCEGSCNAQSATTATANPNATAVTATLVSTTATTSPCGDNCDCCSQCTCAKQNATALTVSTAAGAGCGENCNCCSQCQCATQNSASLATACPSTTAAQWTAATTEFAAIVADALCDSQACCSEATQCTAECGSGCTGSCSSACCTAAKQAAGEPHRIQPPDVLSVYVPALTPKTEETRRELAARGIVFDLPIPFAGVETKQLVQPNGCITLKDVGEIYISGLTVQEAQLAIMKKIFESRPEASRAAFAVFVDVAAKNSQPAYIVIQTGGPGDFVRQITPTPESTVRSAIGNTPWPQPIDFAAARIWISRRGSAGQETLLPVSWNTSTGQPCCDTNHALLPGDRLFVKLEREETTPVPPLPVAPLPVAEFPVAERHIGPEYLAPTPTLFAQPYTPILDGPAAGPVMRFSAIPAAAPSPYAAQLNVYQSQPLVATQAYVTAGPQPPTPQPPVQILPHPVPGPVTDAPAENRDAWARGGKHVEFKIEVVEDLSGSFNEFSKLRDDIIMVSDSDATLAAVRIMENQKLVRRMAAPRLRCALAEQTTICLASVSSGTNDAGDAESVSVQVKAHGVGQSFEGQRMTIETGFQAVSGRQVRELQVSFAIEEGQTAILKTRPEQRPYSRVENAVYVVVTPKLVK